ncbi:innexin unc-9-like [Convolutriloba macropyga]|uniref:innexin unc-9-like n=1 Tax=Convolutriloba macropyga TaxID=536237 RepID=UPI003F525E31
MIAHILKALISVQSANDGDWNDRLNHRYSSVLLLVLAILVSTKQYVGDPINCWTPAHFSREWVEYTNNICWISNTYYLPFEESVKSGKKVEHTIPIRYYQWVPILLAMQGVCFYLPRTIWRGICISTGLDIDKIVNTASTFESVLNPDLWTKTVKYLAKHFDRYFDSQRDVGLGFFGHLRVTLSRIFCVVSKRYGNYLCLLYLFIKVLYIINIFGQLFFLGEWLGAGYHSYGLEVLADIYHRRDWTDKSRFARITLCDFKIRTIGNVQSFTVQCVLSINLFNEKIYLFIWFWLVFVGIATLINFLEWVVRTICFNDRLGYIKKHLKYMDRYNTAEDKKLCKRFVNLYLRPDGVFMIRLLSKNTNSIIVSELVAQLWDNYVSKPHHHHHTIGIPPGTGANPNSTNASNKKPSNNITNSSDPVPYMARKGVYDSTSNRKVITSPQYPPTEPVHYGSSNTYQRRLGSPDGSVVDV